MSERHKFRVWVPQDHGPLMGFMAPLNHDFEVGSKILLEGEVYEILDVGAGYDPSFGVEQVTGAIPMQCTGLKDKNDKLIYEGDILDVGYIGTGERIQDTVIRDDWGFRFKDFHKYPNVRFCEVIGNIHEGVKA